MEDFPSTPEIAKTLSIIRALSDLAMLDSIKEIDSESYCHPDDQS